MNELWEDRMNWENFCKNNRIGSRFHAASLNHSEHNLDMIHKAREWLKCPEQSLILHGKPGRGKTYFSFCLMRDLCERGGEVRWLKSKGFEDKLVTEVREYGNAKSLIETFADVEFLFVDDFGTETTNEDVVREWYHLIDDRWSNAKQTMFTTNLNQDDVLKKYGDRIFSRFRDFEWIEFKGEDLRGRR